MEASIEIISSHKIDKAKWDACIYKRDNGLVYATYDYLNYMSDNWNGIIVNDYDCVMPIPWRKKFGIRYCYDVPFIQQLGWFQQKDADYTSLMIQHFFDFVKYGDYAFNFRNGKVENAFACNNYVLDLSQPYEAMQKNFASSLTRNFKNAYKQELFYSNGDHDNAIDRYKNLYRERMPHVTNDDFENFKKLCKHFSQSNNVIVRNVSNNKNEILASGVFLKDERRLYNIMPSTTEEGRRTRANHFLLENFLKEFAGSSIIFDFEGSDIPGVKNFYEKFGAINQPYQKLHFNHLPSIIKWAKP